MRNITQWLCDGEDITSAADYTGDWINVGDADGIQFFHMWTGAATVVFYVDVSPCRANRSGADAKAPADYYERIQVDSSSTVTFEWCDPPDELDRPVQAIRAHIEPGANITSCYFGLCKDGSGQ